MYLLYLANQAISTMFANFFEKLQKGIGWAFSSFIDTRAFSWSFHDVDWKTNKSLQLIDTLLFLFMFIGIIERHNCSALLFFGGKWVIVMLCLLLLLSRTVLGRLWVAHCRTVGKICMACFDLLHCDMLTAEFAMLYTANWFQELILCVKCRKYL